LVQRVVEPAQPDHDVGVQGKTSAVLDDWFLQPTGIPHGDETRNIQSSQGLDAGQHRARERSNVVLQTRRQKATTGECKIVSFIAVFPHFRA